MLEGIRKHWRFLCLSVLALFCSFAFDLFGAMPVSSFLLNFKDSEALVTNQVTCKGSAYSDQMLEIKHITTSNTQPTCQPSELKPYSSQYGLQGKIYTLGYKAVTHIVSVQPRTYVSVMQLLTALVSAICFGLLALWVLQRFGLFSANSLTLLVAMSPMVVGFARNLYWALPLLILPFIYALYFYDVAAARKRRILFWVGLGFLLYIRYLCGYEYLTSLTIMVAAAVLYHLFLIKSTRRTYIKELALVLAVSVVGFAAALGTHIYSLQSSAGSTSNAIAIIKQRALERTAHSGGYLTYPFTGLKSNLNDYYLITNSYLDLEGRTKNPGQLEATGVSFMNYSFMPVINQPITLNQPFSIYAQSLAAFVVLLSALYVQRKKWVGPDKVQMKRVEALFVGAATGFVGFLSWMILARAHSLVHAHINGILLYLPFALFGYIIIGLYLQSQVQRFRKRLKR